ncbi:MAG TPA: FAD/NAD(P)-binding protein [Streptosporangiaceae bacterium]
MSAVATGYASPAGYAVPASYVVTGRHQETHDTATLTLRPGGQPIAPHRPGQFTMLYAFGVGEVPISVCSPAGGGELVQTIRAVGAVTKALCALEPGDRVGVRGPFGTDWGIGPDRGGDIAGPGRLPDPAGQDLLIVAGGIGLAPLRPALLTALAARERYGRITLLVGSRSPEEISFAGQFRDWASAGADVLVTVDRADTSWRGNVGVVTQLIDKVGIDPDRTVALVCGPEIMMRLTARTLAEVGLPETSIRVSLERNMRCGIAECGHCQLGPVLLCRDGPVLDYVRARPLMSIKEL